MILQSDIAVDVVAMLPFHYRFPLLTYIINFDTIFRDHCWHK